MVKPHFSNPDGHLQKKLLLSHLAVAVIVIFCGLISYLGIKELAGIINDTNNKQLPSVENLLVMENNMQNLRGIMRTLALSGLSDEMRRQQFSELQAIDRNIQKSVNNYSKIPKSKTEKIIWDNTINAMENWKKARETYLFLIRKFLAFGIKEPEEQARQIEQFIKEHYYNVQKIWHLMEMGIEFDGAETDSECEIGKWLKNFRSENEALMTEVQKINPPHQKFHQAIAEIKKACRNGEKKVARLSYEKKMLPAMNEIFATLERILQIVYLASDTRKNAENYLLNTVEEYQTMTIYPIKELVIMARENSQNSARTAENNSAKRLRLAGYGLLFILLALLLGALFSSNLADKLLIMKKRAEEAALRAKKADETKTRFLANVSHEIRTPLNALIGMSHLLTEAGLTSENQKFAEIIHNSGLYLLSLLNDILDLSKIESGHLELEDVDFCLSELLDAISSCMTFRCRQKGLEFNCRKTENCPEFLKGDPGRLRQILNNLCENALKFTKTGKITVSAHCLEKLPDKYNIQFTVCDTGIGIPADKAEKLFQPFKQADSSISRKYGGTGLGLSISRQLVELMGGEIGLKSKEGEGSEFHFNINVKPGQKPAELPENITPHPVSSTLRILIADDIQFNQLVARELLKKLGYSDIDIVSNGTELMQAMENKTYDIILMDCQMPEMDGLTATARIRNMELKNKLNKPDITIIALSAEATEESRKAALQSGMNDYIKKPLRLDSLKAAILKWTGESTFKDQPPA